MKLPFKITIGKGGQHPPISSTESIRKYLVGRLTLLLFVLLLLLSLSLFIPLATVFAAQFGIFSSKLAKTSNPPPVGKPPTGMPEVLAEFDESPASTISPRINFNIPTNFSRDVFVQGNLLVQGRAILPQGIEAPNVVYAVQAGPGIELSGEQDITLINAGVLSVQGQTGDIVLEAGDGIEIGEDLTLTNTGVTSIQGQTGAVTLTAGNGIVIDGTTIATDFDIPESVNSFASIEVSGQDDISAGENDTLTFAAGTGISLTTNSTTKTITITSSAVDTPAGWTDDGSTIRLSTVTDSVGIGTSAPTSKLHVVGDTNLDGNLSLSGSITFSGLTNGILRSTGGVISSGEVALGTDTSGNYLSDLTSGNGIAISGTSGEGWTASASLGALNADWNQSGAFDIILNNADSQLQITGDDGTFTSTFNVDSLTANRTYTFPDLSGEVCLASGNCAGSGAGLGGSGTTNRIARFSATFALEDSSINDLYTGGVGLTIDASGEVGIGTTTPNYALDVAGAVKVGDGSALMLGQGTSDPNPATTPDGAIYYRTTDDRFRCKENGSWKFCDTSVSGGSISGGGTTGGIAYFDSGSTLTSDSTFVWDTAQGRLGIGTSAPAATLDINGDFIATGTVSASNISGVNTGDQTITLTGDVTGTGTGTFATTIGADAVQLGTDTTGNFVATVAGASGIAVSGSGSESAAVSLGLGALSEDWSQSGAFDIILDNADSQLQIKGDDDSFYGTFNVDTLAANRTYTFPDATGTVCLDTGNCSSVGGGVTVSSPGTTNRLARFSGAQNVENSSVLDEYSSGVALTIASDGNITTAGDFTVTGNVSATNLSGTNTGDQTIELTGDVTGSGTGSFATTIAADSVALGTDTTGNYIATITDGNGITVSGSGTESASANLNLGALTSDWNQTGAFDVILDNADSQLQIKADVGNFYGSFNVTTLTANRTYTFPDSSGTVCLTSGNCAGAGGGVVATGYAEGYITKFTSTNNEVTVSALYEDGSGNIGLGNTAPAVELDVTGSIVASGTIAGSNLSGTNTGDQTIELTGDVTGSGTGSFATTIGADAVALGTDTTGNYVATLASGNGVSVSGSGSESAAVSLALGALTADWNQTGAFDIILDNADSQLQIKADTGNFYGAFNVTTLTANRTYTFPDASGTVCLTSGNCAGAGGGVTATGYTSGYITRFTSNTNEITTSAIFEDADGDIGIGNTTPSAKLSVTGNIVSSGTITGSNLSGTNTGDQTITLTGDVTGSGTGSFAATIGADAVALGTDTTGNYVATVASGNGISVSGSGSESAAVSLALGALTADWAQTGAFDIILDNADSQLQIRANTGSFYGSFDVDTLTANRTYTFPDATGTVCLDTGNCAGAGGGVTTAGGTTNTLAKFTDSQVLGDSILSDDGSTVTVGGAITATGNISAANLSGTNTGDQTITLTGDVTGSGTGSFAATIAANAVALGTDTTGNYVATIASGNGVSVSGSGSESAAVSLALGALTADWTQTGAFDIILDNADSQLQIRANTGSFYGIFDVDTLTANRTYTFPDESGEVCLDSGNCAGAGGGVTTDGGTVNTLAKFTAGQEIGDSIITDDGSTVSVGGALTATGNITGANLSGTNTGDQTITLQGDVTGTGTGTFTTTIAANAVALGTDTTGNYVATVASGNGVSVSGSGSESAAVSLALGALTADWSQTGAFDIILDNADSQLQIRANTGSFYGSFDVDTLTANRTYTFPDATGTVCLSTGNCAGAGGGVVATGYAQGYLTKFTSNSNEITVSTLFEDGSGNIGLGNTAPGAALDVTGNIIASGTVTGSNLSGTNTGDQTITLTGDVTGSGTGSFATTISANAVALGTDTTGNYVATVASGNGISVSGSGSESAAVSLALGALTADWAQTGAFDIILDNADSQLQIKADAGEFYGVLNVDTLTADRTYTFPDASGEVCLDSGNCAGAGGGVTTAGGTAGRLARFSDTQEIEDSSIADEASLLAMTITSAGNIGIGTSSSSARVTAQATTEQLRLAYNGTTFAAFTVNSSGDLTVAPSGGDLNVTGNVAATGTVTASNLSGTNTGDQTITLTGDVTGSGTGSFATTISANAVALATDTVGNYVATVSDGNGIAASGSGSENASVTLSLGALTGDWTQSGAFDILLANGSSELRIMESTGATYYGTFDVGDLTADRTYTFPDASGTVSLLSANQTFTGTNAFTNSAGITIGEDLATNTRGQVTLISAGTNNFSTVIRTGTQTQNITYTLPTDDGDTNYVLTTDGSGVLSWANVVDAGGGALGDINAIGDVASGDAFTATGTQGTSLYFYDADGRGQLTVGNLTAARTYTLPDASGTICLTSGNCAGAGSGVTTTGGTENRLAKFTAAQAIGDSIILDDGTTVTVEGDLDASGNITAANLSGTNTGDQTITLTGDVTGSGTGSFATTISANAVALGSDTTGNYVATAADGNGITVTGSGSENAALTLDLGALTSNWSQTGAFDIELANASSELKIMESSGDTYFGIFDVGNLTADRTYTFPDASGTVCLDSGNCAGAGAGVTATAYAFGYLTRFTSNTNEITVSALYQDADNEIGIGNTAPTAKLDVTGNILASGTVTGSNLSGTNTGDQTITLTGDVTGSGTGSFAATIAANAVALGTDTTGNYVATVAGGNGVSVSGSGSESAAVSLALGALTADWAQTGAFDIILDNADSQLQIKADVGEFYGVFNVDTLTADRTYTFPDDSGEVCLNSGNCAGAGGGVTTAGGTTNTIAKFVENQELGDSIITDNGTTVSVGGTLTATGNITGANLSGTNTGDQTITLTGDVTGSGTGSFATTIAANAVALGTDTTGNYVATVASGNGISVSGSGSESAAVSLALGALTSDWSQTGAFDVILDNADSQLQIRSADGAAFYGIFDVDTLAANRTYTFPDESGEVCLDSGNCAGAGGGVTSAGGTTNTLAKFTDTNEIGDSILSDDGSTVTVAGALTATGNITGANLSGTNTGDQTITLTGDVTGSGTGSFATTIAANAVALGTDTTGNYVATVAGGNGVSVSGSGSESAAVSLALGALTSDWNQTGAFDIQLANASSELKIMESTGDTYYGIFDVGNLTADRTYTFPDASGTVCLSSGNCAGAGGGVTSTGYAEGYITKFTSTTNEITISALFEDGSGNIGLGNTAPGAALDVTGNIVASGTVTGSNLSGTNTGDQTITLTGDVTGSGTGSFATTISANAVALGTDTTGNYVATVASGNGISVSGSGSESAAVSLALGALTSDWSQTGAFDIILANADSQLQILESAGGTYYGTLDVGDLGGNKTYTLPDFTGTSATVCLSTGNCAGSGGGVTTGGGTVNTIAKFVDNQELGDSILSDDGSTVTVAGALDATGNITGANLSGTNTGDQTITLTGDVTGSGTGSFAATIAADAVALGTDTTGNYVATIASGNGVSVSGSGSETAAVSLALGALTSDWSQTGAFDIILDNADSQLQIRANSGAFYGTFDVDTLTANRTYTFPDATGTVCLDTGNCAGAGGGVTTSGGTTNRLAKFTDSQEIGDSSISDSGDALAMTIDSSENIGIGISSSLAYKLHVNGTLGVAGSLGTISTSTSGNNLNFSRAGANYIDATNASGSLYLGVGGVQRVLRMEPGAAQDALNITSTAGANNLALFGGKVGIGMSNPARMLDITTTTNENMLGLTNTSGNTIAIFQPNDSTGVAQLSFGTSTNGDRGRIRYQNSDDSLTFYTNDTARAVFDNSGNFRINAQGDLRFGDSDTSNYVAIQAPGTLSADYTLTLPGDDGTAANQVLVTNGSGVLSWASLSGIGAGGDITAVGSMTSGDAFADSSADDDWLGLGASAGRIEFDDQTTDEVNILDAYLGLGTTAPTARLNLAADTTAAGGILFGTDTNLYRYAANTLRTDDGLIVGTRNATINAGDIFTSGALSIGTVSNTPASSAILDVVDSRNWSGSGSGIRTLFNVTPTTTGQSYTGAQIVARDNAANTNNIGLLTGVSSSTQIQSTTGITLTNMQAYSGTLSVPANSTVSNAYGYLVNNLTNTGTIANTYGVYVGDITTGTQTNTPFSFYASDVNANNYFAGNVGIGTSGPSAKLDVRSTSEQLRLAYDASNYSSFTVSSGGDLTIAPSGGDTTVTGTLTTSSNLTVNAQGDVRFADSDSSNYAAIQAPTTIGTNYTLTLPDNDGSAANEVLVTDGNGVLSWASLGGLGSGGDITAVGSMTTGDAFADSTADDDWLGLGASAGRIEFDDQTIDEINILDANVGIGTTAPTGKLAVIGTANDEQLIVRANGTQTANLQEWQNSSGTALTAIEADGDLNMGSRGIVFTNSNARIERPSGIAMNITANTDGTDTTGFRVSSTTSATGSTQYGSTIAATKSVADSFSYNGLQLITTDSASTGTQALLRGMLNTVRNTGAGTLTMAYALHGRVDNTSTGTIGTGIGAFIDTNVNSGGGTFTDNYGILVAAQSAGTNDYGVAIAAADTQTLWLSSTTNSTVAAGGIAFGSSRDTNLYRSAANTLMTDDSFTVGADLTVNAQGDVRFADSDSSNYAAIQAPSTIGTNYTLTLPDNDGSAANEVLVTDGNGVLSWASLGGLGSGGDITAVGSMTTGDAFAGSSADDDWLGLGASAGRIEFDDQTIDEINFLGANVGIGTTAPGYSLDVTSVNPTATAGINNNLSRTSGTTSAYGVQSLTTVSSTSLVGYGVGVSGQLNYQGSGGISNAAGGRFIGAISGSAPSTANISGVLAEASTSVAASSVNGVNVASWGNTGSGALTIAKGMNIATPINSGGGSISTAYGLYINNINAGTTNYSIYSNGGNSYHAGTLGIGTLPANTYGLNVLHLATDQSSDFRANSSEVRVKATSANSQYNVAAFGLGRVTSDTTANLTGQIIGGWYQTNIESTSAISVSNARAFTAASYLTANSLATVTNTRGVEIQLGNQSTAGGVMTTATGLYVNTPTATGTITNAIGINVDNQAGSSVSRGIRVNQTSGHSLYIDGSAPSYFAGNIGIGTSSAGAKLHSLATTEQLRLGYDASNYSSFTISSGGDLTVAPSGGDTTVTGTLTTSSNLTVNAQGDLRLADSDSTNYAAFQSPTTIGTNYTLTLPDTDGDNGQVLQSDGNGVLSWVTPSSGTGDITDVGSMSSGVAFGDANADDDWLGLGASAGRIFFDDQTVDVVGVLDAQLGIGTTSFQSSQNMLAIARNDASTTRIELNNSDVAGGTGLRFYEGATTGGNIFWDNASNILYLGADTADGEIIFNTATEGDPFANERMRIADDGNVGIGVTDPSQKLDVGGAIRLGVAGANNTLNTTAAGGAPSASLYWGDEEICTSADNCSSSGTVGGTGTQNYLAKWSVGGTDLENSLFYDDGTSVGIGTETLSAKLHIYQNTPAADQTLFQIGTSDDATRFSVDEDGDTYIDGTISLAGGGVLRGFSTSYFGNKLSVGTSSTTARIYSLDTSEQLRLAYDASNYASFTVNSGGDLTLSPSGGDFTIEGSTLVGLSTDNQIGLNLNSSATSAEGRISVLSPDTNADLFINSKGSGGIQFNFDSGTGGVGFYDGAGARRAYINTSGSMYLGGNSSPANRLSVNGSASFGSYASTAAPSNGLIVSGDVGIGTTLPGAKLESLATTEQLRLAYDASNYASFTTSSSGDLSITPTGSDTNITGNVQLIGAAGSSVTLANSECCFSNRATLTVTAAGGGSGEMFQVSDGGNTFFSARTGISTFRAGLQIEGTSITTDSVLEANGNSLTSGKGLNVNSSATAFTGTLADISLTGSNAANTGTIFKASSTGTLNTGTVGMFTNLGTGLSLRINDETGDTDSTPFVIDASGNVGIGTSSPTAKLYSLATTEQLRLAYDASNYSSFTVNSTGDMTVAPTGGDLAITGNASTSLDFTITGNDLNFGNGGSISNGTAGLLSVDNGSSLVLANQASDPATATNGAQYYNTTDNKFRCYINGAWADCDGSGSVITVGSMSGATLFADANADDDWIGLGSTAGRFEFDDQATDEINFLNANIGIGTTAPTSQLDVVSTGTTTNGFSLGANSLTTGYASSITSTSTALTSGRLLNVEWNPGSATTATGDLARLSINGNANIGNFLNIVDNNSSIFSVSESAFTTSLPVSFTAPGDVSIAYDLMFTNTLASYVKSAAPLYIQAGETFNSSDLTLQTYNSGKVVLEAAGGVESNASILPAVDDTYDLGSSSFRWRDLYLGPASLHLGTNGNEAVIGYNTSSNTLTLNPSGDGSAEVTISDAGAITASAITVNSQAVCLADGTNCPAGGTNYWSRNASTGYLSAATSSDKLALGTASPSSSTTLAIGGSVTIGNYANDTAPSNGLIVSGNVGIGDNSPAALFTVGSGDMFQINSSGNITKINNITYSFPSLQAAGNGYVLTNDGSGNLSWGAPSGGGTWLRNSGSGYLYSSTTSDKVAIGDWSTGTPQSLLSVKGGLALGTYAASNTAGSGAIIAEKISVGTTNTASAVQINGSLNVGGQTHNAAPTNGLYVSGVGYFGNSSPTAGMELQVDGNLMVDLSSSGNLALCHPSNSSDNQEIVDCSSTPTADYMEMYPLEPSATEGDIVAVSNEFVTTKDGDKVSKLAKTTTQYQKNVIGIVSNKANAGDFNSIGHNIEEADNPQPIALTGRVKVKMSQSSAAIEAGDYVTTSTEAGKGMKATKAGYVVGKALESWTPGQETVMVFVNYTYADPEGIMAKLSIDENGTLTSPKMKAEQITLGNNGDDLATMLDTQSQAIDQQSVDLTALKSLTEDRMNKMEQDIATMSAALAQLNNTTNVSDVASISARIDQVENRTLALEEEVASISAKLADLIIGGGNASDSASLAVASTSAALEELIVSGNTNLTDLGVTGTISAGMLTIEGYDTLGEAAINTLAGPLKIQSLGLNGVELIGGKIAMDTDGNMKVAGEITTKKVNIDTTDVLSASAGKGIIKVGTTYVDIETTAVTEDSLVFVTATTKTGQQLSVTVQIAGESFRVEMPVAQSKDVTFNWWIVDNVVSDNTASSSGILE